MYIDVSVNIFSISANAAQQSLSCLINNSTNIQNEINKLPVQCTEIQNTNMQLQNQIDTFYFFIDNTRPPIQQNYHTPPIQKEFQPQVHYFPITPLT